MEEKVMRMVRGSLEIPPENTLTLGMSPEDIPEWDSMSMLNLFSALESEFHVQIEFEDMVEINTLRDIVEMVRRKSDEN